MEGYSVSDHYYSRKPQTESKPRHWNFTLLGHNFRFETDAGVFSKSEVDFGSRVLIDAFEAPDLEGDIFRCRLWIWTNRSLHCKSK